MPKQGGLKRKKELELQPTLSDPATVTHMVKLNRLLVGDDLQAQQEWASSPIWGNIASRKIDIVFL